MTDTNMNMNDSKMDTKAKKPLQESFLNDLRKNKTNVAVYMVNGIKLEGQILSFDQYSILLGGKVDQIVYKQKISTIAPSDHGPRPTDKPQPDK